MASLGRRGDKLNLLVRRGATLGPYEVTMQDAAEMPIDLTSAIVRAKIRKEYDSVTAYTITCTVTDGAAGEFSFTMTATETAAIPYLGDLNEPDYQYIWDLEIEYPDETVEAIFYGIVKVASEVTYT